MVTKIYSESYLSNRGNVDICGRTVGFSLTVGCPPRSKEGVRERIPKGKGRVIPNMNEGKSNNFYFKSFSFSLSLLYSFQRLICGGDQ